MNDLDFGLADRVRGWQRPLYAALETAIDKLGSIDVAAAAAQCRRQDLRDALSSREGRRLAVEWPWGIGAIAPEAYRAQIAAALVAPLGYGIAPIRPLTDAEKLARLEYRVAARFGAAGADLVEENRR